MPLVFSSAWGQGDLGPDPHDLAAPAARLRGGGNPGDSRSAAGGKAHVLLFPSAWRMFTDLIRHLL